MTIAVMTLILSGCGHNDHGNISLAGTVTETIPDSDVFPETGNQSVFENEYYSFSYDRDKFNVMSDGAYTVIIYENPEYHEAVGIEINVWDVFTAEEAAADLDKNDHMTTTTIRRESGEIFVDTKEEYSADTLEGFAGDPFTASIHYRLAQRDGYYVIVKLGFDYKPDFGEKEEKILDDSKLSALLDSIKIK